MPPAIIGAAIALGASAAAAAGYIAASVALAISLAATAAGALLTKTPSYDFNAYKNQQERKQVLRASASSRTVIYGTTLSSGLMNFAEEQQGDQVEDEWLHMSLVLAGHKLNGIGEIWLGDDQIQTYGDYVTWQFHNDPQVVDQFMLDNTQSWKEDMIGKGLAWLRISFRFNAEKFPSGLPNVRVVKRGRELYDPRSGQTVFTDNAALVILDYFRTYLKRDDKRINWDQFKIAANICDETVATPGGQFERRYTINGEFDLEEASSKILDSMLQACGGELTYIGGKHGLLVGAYYGPAVLTLDESCISGNIKIVPETSFKERTNTMTGTFIDPTQMYSESDFPNVSVAEWVQKDGGEITQDTKYRFVQSEFQAQRLSNITLRRKRVGRTIQVPCNMRGYKFRPGMYVNVKIAVLGINNVEMRVTKWSFDPKGGVQLTLRQDFIGMWDDAIGKPMERPDLVDLPTGGVAQPQNLQYQVLTISDVVQGLLVWSNTGQVAYNRVAIKQGGATIWTAQVPGQSVRVTGLLRGGYTAHVQAVGYTGAVSTEAYLEFNIQAPPPPTSVEVQNGYFAITLIPKIKDLTSVSTQFDFWTSGETKLQSSATDIVEAQATRKGMGTTWTQNNLLNDHTYYWYVRTINAFGSSVFVEVAALVHAETGELMDIVDSAFQQTDTYKNLVASVKEVEDGVTSLEQTVATNDSKYTEQINSVQSSVGGLSATVQQQASAFADLNGKLSAQWGQKVQIDVNGNKYVAGMQMGVEGQGGQYQSYWMVSADNFAVYNPVAGAAQLAFLIKGGQTFIREGFIENGSINNLKIGNIIQSYNWNGNDVGWAIVKDGWAVFNNVTVRGTVYATNGEFTGVIRATSFVGDIVNGNVYPDTESVRIDKPAGGTPVTGSRTYYFNFNDSTTGSYAKKVVFDLNLSRSVSVGLGETVSVTININGNARTYSPTATYTLLRHSAVVTSPTVNVAVTIAYSLTHTNAHWLLFQAVTPMMQIMRGSGSFYQ